METDRKTSAVRQTVKAIECFRNGEWDCAITLAAAAEGMLPATSDPHLFQQIKSQLSEDEFKALGLNDFSVWLKHPKDAQTATISEFEVVVWIARAITKFVAVFHQSHPTFEEFMKDGHEMGHLPKLYKS